MRTLALAALAAAAAACPSPPGTPAPEPPSLRPDTGPEPDGAEPPAPLSVWTVAPGLEPEILVLVGPPAPAGTRVSIIDDRGLVGHAEVLDQPPPECDDCPADRLSARGEAVMLPLEGTAVAVYPPDDVTAGLHWYSYPEDLLPGPEPRPWLDIDADGDGTPEAVHAVWCAEPIPSGCNDRTCARVCRGPLGPDGTPQGPATCRGLVPDVDDCVLFPGGCARDDIGCRNIALLPPAEGPTAVYVSQGVRMEFRAQDVRAAAARFNVPGLPEYLAGAPGPEIRLDTPAAAELGNRVEMVLAWLLQEGQARVIDPSTGEPVEYLVQQDWVWTGCGGGCRQSGREWRFRIPGESFFRVTDMYMDGR